MPGSRLTHTVVISDVHLCNAMPGEELWLRYRQRRFFPDNDFAALFELLCFEARGGDMEMVFAGDLFDLDAPPIVNGEVSVNELPRNEQAAIIALTDILDDHDVFVLAVGRVLAAGHRIVFMSGNHDPQLVFAGVRRLLHERISQAAREAGSTEGDESLSGRIGFRAWFHTTGEGIHIEHGNQYDPYCSFRYPVEPFTKGDSSIQPTLGSLAFRNLVSKMGYLNPYNDKFVMMSITEYLSHWMRYYLFSRRFLVLAWVGGSVRTFMEAWSSRTSADAARSVRTISAYAAEIGADDESTNIQAALFSPPSEDARLRVLHELGLDRILLLSIGICASIIVWWAFGEWNSLKVIAATIAFMVTYEIILSKKPILDTVYIHVDACEREVARIQGARAIVFGHTHVPFGIWEDGTFYGNSGTWAPGFRDIECSTPLVKGRPFIWLRGIENGPLKGGLYHFENGEIHSRSVR